MSAGSEVSTAGIHMQPTLLNRSVSFDDRNRRRGESIRGRRGVRRDDRHDVGRYDVHRDDRCNSNCRSGQRDA